jgi:hypothetical protein
MNAGSPWVAHLNAAEANALADLRLAGELEVAEIGEAVWLRGPALNDPLRLALRKIPGLCRFDLIEGERLLAEGARVPRGRLPELRWQPLPQWLEVCLPAMSGATATLAGVPLRLVRSCAEQHSTGLLTDLAAWLVFAVAAAEIRLRPLRFAAARDGRVWIEGTPLPAVAGRRFCIQHGVAVPNGYTWASALPAVALRHWLALADGDVALAAEDGGWEIIKAEQFVPATRSAVRATAEALAHG